MDEFSQKIDEIQSAKEAHKLTIAAAGSGKTSLLIEILFEKIKKGEIDLLNERVIIFTFTNNAADELSFRIGEKLNELDLNFENVFIGTIHSWCDQYLKENFNLSNTKLMDELERDQFILRIYDYLEIEENYEGDYKFQKLRVFMNDLEIFYDENLDINDPIIASNSKICLQKYLEISNIQRLLDFGSLIRNSIIELNKAKKLEKRFLPSHLFIDEYQDVNKAQVSLFKSILATNSRNTLFAVGDPRQAIYQWRGSDLSRLIEFDKDYNDSKLFFLSINHRSRPGIVKFANIIANDIHFGQNFAIGDMHNSKKREDNEISVINLDLKERQEDTIINLIEQLINVENVKIENITILMRSVVNHSDLLMHLLKQKKIPFYSPNHNFGINFVNDFMISILNLIEIMEDDMEPANQSEEEEIKEKTDLLLEKIKKYAPNNSKTDIHIAISKWHKKLITKNKSNFANENYNFRNQLFKFCQEIEFKITKDNLALQEGFSSITQIMKAMENVFRRRFRSYSKRSSPIFVLTKNFKWQLENEIERWAKIGLASPDKSSITISTVHAAKGLEWPVVIVPFLWKNRFPLRKSYIKSTFPEDLSLKYGNTLEDEKRLWYVAATRARDRLYLLSGGNINHSSSPFIYKKQLENDMNLMSSFKKIPNNVVLSKIIPYQKTKYQKIGVSDLLILLECPYQYYLRKIKGIEVPISFIFGSGNIIHKIIERLVKNGKEDINEIIGREVYLPLAELFVEKKQKIVIKEKIEKLLKKKLIHNIHLSECKFDLTENNFIISGIIDAIKEDNKGITIIDWKSSIKDGFIERYKNQILIYALGLTKFRKSVKNSIIYNLANLDNNYSFEITNKLINQINFKIKNSISLLNLDELVFIPEDKSCRICDISILCPEKKGVIFYDQKDKN